MNWNYKRGLNMLSSFEINLIVIMTIGIITSTIIGLINKRHNDNNKGFGL